MNLRWTTPLILAPVLVAAIALPAAGQNYELDARNVGMGSLGSTRNIAANFFEERQQYRTLGLPFGLFQVLANKKVFFYNPDKNDFDMFRSVEYARNPLHYTFNRNASNTGKTIGDDIMDGDLNRNLSVYRVFRPAQKYLADAGGLPNWGATIKFGRTGEAKQEQDKRKRDDGGFQGIYIGAGPYFTATTDTRVDQQFIDVLGSEPPTSATNANMTITHATGAQVAAAIIGGYRVYIPHKGAGLRREGVYFAANIAYLIGVDYTDLDTTIHFDTDGSGLLTLAPTTAPIEINYLRSRHGQGRVMDLGLAVTLAHWDFGVGITGIANQITWQDVERQRLQLASYFDGSRLEEVDAPPVTGPLKVTVPLNSSVNAVYTATDKKWSVAAAYARRFDGNNIQIGVDRRFHTFDLRGGMHYAGDRWHPAGGIGLNLSKRVSFDVAIFSTSTNVELRRTAALAFSFRFAKEPKGENR